MLFCCRLFADRNMLRTTVWPLYWPLVYRAVVLVIKPVGTWLTTPSQTNHRVDNSCLNSCQFHVEQWCTIKRYQTTIYGKARAEVHVNWIYFLTIHTYTFARTNLWIFFTFPFVTMCAILPAIAKYFSIFEHPSKYDFAYSMKMAAIVSTSIPVW